MATLTLEQANALAEQKRQNDQLAFQQELAQKQALNELSQQSQAQKLQGALSGDVYGNGALATKSSGNPLIDAFQQYQNQQTATDPFMLGARSIRQVALPKSDSIWENLLGAGAQGLGAGILGQLGQNNVDSGFREDLMPTLGKLYPQLQDSLGTTPTIDAGKMALIAAIGDETHSNKLEELGMKVSSKNGGKYGASPMSDEAIQLIADRAGITFEKAKALSDVSPYQLQTMMYTLGANTKPLGDSSIKTITGGDNAIFSINEARKLADDLTPGLLSALQAGKITDLYKNPDSTSYKFYAQVDKLKKEVARMNDSGALTQLDVDMFAPLTSGSPVYDSKEAIKERLDDLERYVANKRQQYLEASGKAGRNVSGFNLAGNDTPSLSSSLIPTVPQGTNGLPNIGSDFQGGKVVKITRKK